MKNVVQIKSWRTNSSQPEQKTTQERVKNLKEHLTALRDADTDSVTHHLTLLNETLRSATSLVEHLEEEAA